MACPSCWCPSRLETGQAQGLYIEPHPVPSHIADRGTCAPRARRRRHDMPGIVIPKKPQSFKKRNSALPASGGHPKIRQNAALKDASPGGASMMAPWFDVFDSRDSALAGRPDGSGRHPPKWRFDSKGDYGLPARGSSRRRISDRTATSVKTAAQAQRKASNGASASRMFIGRRTRR